MNELMLSGTQSFMGKGIPVVSGGFGEGKRCLSDKTIAEIHGMEFKNVRARITYNIKRFKENVDFIDLKQRAYEASTLELLQKLGYAIQSITQAGHIYLLSERGYAKLIKIMDTDKAWEVHDKLIDEYFTMRDESDIFNNISVELRAAIAVDKRVTEVEKEVSAVNDDLQEFKKDMPLLALECQKITKAKNRKVVPLLGGHNAPAYKNKSLCKRVYGDLETQMNRQFGVDTYKAIKRNQCDQAVEIIQGYELPMVLEQEIANVNAQIEMRL